MQGIGYTVFGKVVSGMDVVDKIAKAPTGAGGPVPQGRAARRQSSSTRPSVVAPIRIAMVILHTNHGDITLELDAENAPKTVANFLQYVRVGHYDNTIFHRVIDGFMIQGGGMEPGMKQKPTRATIANEAGNGLKNRKYTVAMARTSEPHSASSQFFINVADNDFLDYKGPSPQGWGYCVFGKVVAGQDVVDRIKGVPTGNSGFHQNVPNEDVVITRAEESRPRAGSDRAGDPVPLRSASVAGAAGAGGRVPRVLRGPGARSRRRLRPGRPVRRLDRRRPAARAARRGRRARDQGRDRGRSAGRRDHGQPRFPARRALREAAGVTLLPGQLVVNLAGTPTLLLHGDELCTADHAYQRFRRIAHDARWQRPYLALPYRGAPRHRAVAAPPEPAGERGEARARSWTSRRRRSRPRFATPA